MKFVEVPTMGSLTQRVERIEERLKPECGPWLQWPNSDGTFTEAPGCRSLNDVYAKYVLPYERARAKGETDHADRIRHNPTP
jgi:hypothetical protein